MVGCGVGAYRDSEHVAFLRDRLREEVDRIAEKKGIDFDKADTSSTFGSKVRDAGALFHAAGSGCGAPHGSGHVRRCGGAHGA